MSPNGPSPNVAARVPGQLWPSGQNGMSSWPWAIRRSHAIRTAASSRCLSAAPSGYESVGSWTILAIPVVGTLKRVGTDHVITETVDRTGLWEAQTPQVFARDLLTRALAATAADRPTDEARAVEALGHSVTVVPGSPINLKITSREDLKFAEHALKALPTPRLAGPAHPFAGDDVWR